MQKQLLRLTELRTNGSSTATKRALHTCGREDRDMDPWRKLLGSLAASSRPQLRQHGGDQAVRNIHPSFCGTQAAFIKQ